MVRCHVPDYSQRLLIVLIIGVTGGGFGVAELGGEFGAVVDAEFGVDVGEVELDGFDADE